MNRDEFMENAPASWDAVWRRQDAAAERPITSAELYHLASRQWMPAAAAEALVRAARTIAALAKAEGK